MIHLVPEPGPLRYCSGSLKVPATKVWYSSNRTTNPKQPWQELERGSKCQSAHQLLFNVPLGRVAGLSLTTGL